MNIGVILYLRRTYASEFSPVRRSDVLDAMGRVFEPAAD